MKKWDRNEFFVPFRTWAVKEFEYITLIVPTKETIRERDEQRARKRRIRRAWITKKNENVNEAKCDKMLTVAVWMFSIATTYWLYLHLRL